MRSKDRVCLVGVGLALLAIILIPPASQSAGAWFSDTEKSKGNLFSAGTIDLAVGGQNPWKETIVLEEAKPCETRWISREIKNVGTNEFDVWKRITNIVYSDGLHPESENDEDSCGNTNNIGSVIRYDLKINCKWIITEDEGFTIEHGDHHLKCKTKGVAGLWIYLGKLQPGETMFVEQSYHLDKDTTNWAQGDTMKFDIEYYVQQTVGHPAPPGPELQGHGRP